MRTERQIEASRANGAKSRGPVTADGKRNSRGNALKHGLLADTIVLKGELEERFLKLLADFERELQPETTIELLLVQKMAAAQWRQFRLWGMEKAAMEYQIRNQADTVGRGEDNATRASLAFQTLSDDSRSLDLFHRYDSLCDRQYLRAHKRFLELRCGRGDSPAPAPSNLKPEVPPAPETHAPQDLDMQPVWESFIPQPSSGDEQAPGELTNEKQPNEPDNSLETLEPATANPTLKPGARNPDPPHACVSTSETGSNSASTPESTADGRRPPVSSLPSVDRRVLHDRADGLERVCHSHVSIVRVPGVADGNKGAMTGAPES